MLSDLLQGCSNKSDTCSHDIAILLQPCVVKFVTFLLYHDCISDLLEQPCNKSDTCNAIKCSANTTCQQGCYKLLTVYSKLVDNLGQAVRRQLVDRLATRCEIFTCVCI